MRIISAYFCSFLLALSLLAQDVEDPCFSQWILKSTSQFSKYEAANAVVEGKIYVISGFTEGIKAIPAVEIYDPATDSWSQGVDIPHPVTHAGAITVNDEIWIVGGFLGDHPGVATDKIQIYNTVEDEWREGPALPNPRGSGAAVYRDGYIHFFGGLLPDRQTDVAEHYVLDTNDISAGWSTLADFPKPRNHFSAILFQGKIYALGGQFGHDADGEGEEFVDVNHAHVYDPTTDEWKELAPLPENRGHFEPGTFIYDGKIFIAGGRVDSKRSSDDLTYYDPELDEWHQACKLPAKLLAPVAKEIDGKLYLSNGGLKGAGNVQNKLYVFDFDQLITLSSRSTALALYPNPAKNEIRFSLHAHNVNDVLHIYDLNGNKILRKTGPDISKPIRVSQWPSGIYIYRLKTSGKTHTGRFFID